MTSLTEANITTPVTETLNNRVSVRSFTDEKIPDELLRSILNAARRSPTSSNTQTYSFVVVRDQAVKKRLAVLAGNQKHVEHCPVFVAVCADINRLAIALDLRGEQLAKSLETTLVATVDAALAGMSLQTAAESFGLGGVMIGGMRNHPKEAAELLGLPEGVYIVYGMCLGWPDWERVPPQKPRLPEDLVIHYERYDESDPRAKISAYDHALAAYYGAQNRNLDQAAWTGVLAAKLNTPRRPELRQTLEEMGFSFD